MSRKSPHLEMYPPLYKGKWKIEGGNIIKENLEEYERIRQQNSKKMLKIINNQ